ncbi:MAG: hypothetical protein JWN30_2033 [Bacilli bacterium]|nr:hypothetical protein [Bacilli bacterium]
MSFWIWLIVAAVLLAVELGIGTYYLLWIAASAALTFLLSILTSNLLLQLVFFLISSIAAYLLSRPYVKRMRMKKGILLPADLLPGQTGRMQMDAGAGSIGTVRVGAELWSCRADSDLQAGELVSVEKVESSILLVKPVS